MRYGIVIKSPGKKFSSKTLSNISFYMIQGGFEVISDEIYLTDKYKPYDLEDLFNFVKNLRTGLKASDINVPINVYVFNAIEWSNLTHFMD